jgi:hypothetical protein
LTFRDAANVADALDAEVFDRDAANAPPVDASASSPYAEYIAWLHRHEIQRPPEDGNCHVLSDNLLGCERPHSMGDQRTIYHLVVLAPKNRALISLLTVPVGAGPLSVLDSSERARYFVRLEHSLTVDGAVVLREHPTLSCEHGREHVRHLRESSPPNLLAALDKKLVEEVCHALGTYVNAGSGFIRSPPSKTTAP